MSLTASMWTSVSGLLAHGEKMNVIGNNIANVNTVGFKGSRMDFQDFVHQTVNSAAGPSQIGRGVAIGAIFGDFSQGAFETSTESTDMAISGNGFFRVKPKNSEDSYYTRAGNFRFDAEGYLVDPHGYVLQGWAIETESASMSSSGNTGASNNSRIKGTGVPIDIRLDTFGCSPKHTAKVTLAVNLDPTMGTEKSHVDPALGSNLAALFNNWDATPDPGTGNIAPPLGNDGFAYQQSITVYDEGGTAHVLTVYFDKVEADVDNMAEGTQLWEYIVTMDPANDKREFGDPAIAVPDEKKGILMTGTLSFSSNGQVTDMSAFVPTEGGAGFANLNTWVAAPISSNGYPMFAANFSGRDEASNVWAEGAGPTVSGPGTINPNVRGYMTEFTIGMKSASNWWDIKAADATFGAMANDASLLAGMGKYGTREQPASTANGSGKGNDFYERYAHQDGYTYGELSSIHVTQDGVVTGRYSNGVTLELFQITLYDFNSPHNLHREGGNLYSQTRESGDPTTGAANSGGMGAIYSNNLEMSNVDLAREFVNMITTQRGFQANSKSITTTDTMLETVVNMKR